MIPLRLKKALVILFTLINLSSIFFPLQAIAQTPTPQSGATPTPTPTPTAAESSSSESSTPTSSKKTSSSSSTSGSSSTCQSKKGFFDFPTWYKYLPLQKDPFGKCYVSISNFDDKGKLAGINKGYLLIGFAVLEILLHVAALVAVGFVITGGVKYITSSGMPDKESQARQTAINALVGLVIAVVSGAIVNYIAGRF